MRIDAIGICKPDGGSGVVMPDNGGSGGWNSDANLERLGGSTSLASDIGSGVETVYKRYFSSGNKIMKKHYNSYQCSAHNALQ